MTVDGIDAALARAQAAMQHPKKTKVNPHFKSDYADLADVLNAVRPALNAEGIAVVQSVESGELVTELRRNGEVIRSAIPLNLDVKPQELGSQLSYLRRYALSAIAGVASEADDDGNAASAAKPRQQRRRQTAEDSANGPGGWDAGDARFETPRPKANVNADGERLASKEQTAQFTALCDHLEMERTERAAYVKLHANHDAWKHVTHAEAAQLVDRLKGSKLDLFERGDGGWSVIEAGQDAPFTEPPGSLLDERII